MPALERLLLDRRWLLDRALKDGRTMVARGIWWPEDGCIATGWTATTAGSSYSEIALVCEVPGSVPRCLEIGRPPGAGPWRPAPGTQIPPRDAEPLRRPAAG